MNISLKPFFRLICLTLLVGLALNACTNGAQTDTNASLSQETATVGQMMYVDTYETTGAIAALNRATLQWSVTGTILDVYVEPGQMVKAGDALMTIDPATANLANAEKEVENARVALQSLATPDVATITAANKALAAALTAWCQAQADLTAQLNRYGGAGDYHRYTVWYYTDAALTVALNALPLASASLDVQMAFQSAHAAALHQAANAQAQIALTATPEDSSLQRRAADVAAAWQEAQVEAEARRASLSEDEQTRLVTLMDALAAFDQAANDFIASFDGDTAFEYAVRVNTLMATYQNAGVSLDNAVLNLYALIRQPDPDAYAVAMERLETTEQNLKDLQDGLVLTAPIDGQVIAVNFKPGDTADTKTIAVDLIDREHLYLNLYVEESRVIKLKVGDPAEISIEAIPDLQLDGQVAYINPVGANSQGVVYYQVRVDIEQPEVEVLIGATANVSIRLGEPRQVLVAPVAAVQNDSDGEYVYRVSGGQYERVAVVSGLILADDTVIIEGNLSAGDTVVLFTSAVTTNQNQRIPGIFR